MPLHYGDSETLNQHFEAFQLRMSNMLCTLDLYSLEDRKIKMSAFRHCPPTPSADRNRTIQSPSLGKIISALRPWLSHYALSRFKSSSLSYKVGSAS